jgi:hypothetical protein
MAAANEINPDCRLHKKPKKVINASYSKGEPVAGCYFIAPMPAGHIFCRWNCKATL